MREGARERNGESEKRDGESEGASPWRYREIEVLRSGLFSFLPGC